MSFSLRMQYRGEERTTEIPLTQDMMGQLAIEAWLRDMKIGEVVSEVIIGVIKGDLFQSVLDRTKTSRRRAHRRDAPNDSARGCGGPLRFNQFHCFGKGRCSSRARLTRLVRASTPSPAAMASASSRIAASIAPDQVLSGSRSADK